MAVTPDGRKVYVTNTQTQIVSVIDTATDTVVGSPIPVGAFPVGVAVTPDGRKVYVTNQSSDTVSVIDTATDTVVGSPIPVGRAPTGVAVTPDGRKVYVANNAFNGTVSVIDTATDTVVGSIPGFASPFGVAVTPDGRKVYVANENLDTVLVIDTATDTVVGSPIPVGLSPRAFGMFIQRAPRFAGTPGRSNCFGQSVSALARQYGGLNAAAEALGYPSVQAKCHSGVLQGIVS